MSIRYVLLVAAGGAVGSVLRYTLSGVAQRSLASASAVVAAFPVGTLLVNVSGSLLIGLVAGLAESRTLFGAEARLLLVTGVLGGYTTFSAFSLETLLLLRTGQTVSAFANLALQVFLGLAAAFLGYTAGASSHAT